MPEINLNFKNTVVSIILLPNSDYYLTQLNLIGINSSHLI